MKLTAGEIEAIGEMVSSDPVEKERGELEKIRALLEKDEKKGLTEPVDKEEGEEEVADKEGEEEVRACVAQRCLAKQ